MTFRDFLARCRAVVAPREAPVLLTYAEVVALAKAGETKCDRMAYDLFGMLDCGNADVFMSMVHVATDAGWDDARVRAFLWPLMQDGVFVRRGGVVVLNTEPGPDGLAPLQRAVKPYEDVYSVSWLDEMAKIVNAAHAAAAENKPQEET
jgi:hypothetical protein